MAIFRFLLVTFVVVFGASQGLAQMATQDLVASAPGRATDDPVIAEVAPIRTESPRSTLHSMYRLRDELEASLSAYWQQQDRVNAARVTFVIDEIRALIDLSQVPLAARREVGTETALSLLDILGRVKPINVAVLPGTDTLDDQSTTGFRLPGTPLRIVEIAQGDRAGEYLFSADTVQSAPRFLAGLRKLPLRSSVSLKSWVSTGRQLAGPWIPTSVIERMPDILTRTVLDTPAWKILLVLTASLAVYFVARAWHTLLTQRLTSDAVQLARLRLLSPLGIMAMVLWLRYLFSLQINTSGRFFEISETCLVAVFYAAAAWSVWLASKVFFGTIVHDTRNTSGLDDALFWLTGRVVGAIGGLFILGYGAAELGVPVLSVITGFGIGGIAVAMAARPTLENLIGGFILFIDKPVRVGDFCTFGGTSGTVEEIGVRSTQIRAIDRTRISIPNAQFVDMQLVNWAQCDTMLIHEALGLRFETDMEQLRHVLAKIREMLHAHPRIEPETIRVRFVGYGESSLNIDLRIHAKTREWNDFYSIREDVLMRIGEIVDASGSAFAFPSQTLYWSRDTGLDAARTEKAHQEVARWRRQRELPFPRFSSAALERFSGKVKYPPPGSPDYFATDEDFAEGGEMLSADQSQSPDLDKLLDPKTNQ
ncbi:mechanosensitive ion channel family protein [Phaeobacter marinintestinus]|uniref:mechanosensitive ion channel family protein n=1 Tax=Falsiphaeobacter marinintestinus TaxID=1492905 RepID=UPI0011B52D9A|nr:mechanosensitive ion channel family protein [Phaeobacter marinintestinus]